MHKLKFDYKVKTKDGYVMAAVIHPIGIQASMDKEVAQTRDINVFHKQVFHRNKPDMLLTAERLNLKLTGDMRECNNCGRGKVNRKMIKYIPMSEITEPGVRIAMDITGCSTPSYGGSLLTSNWIMEVVGNGVHS